MPTTNVSPPTIKERVTTRLRATAYKQRRSRRFAEELDLDPSPMEGVEETTPSRSHYESKENNPTDMGSRAEEWRNERARERHKKRARNVASDHPDDPFAFPSSSSNAHAHVEEELYVREDELARESERKREQARARREAENDDDISAAGEASTVQQRYTPGKAKDRERDAEKLERALFLKQFLATATKVWQAKQAETSERVIGELFEKKADRWHVEVERRRRDEASREERDASDDEEENAKRREIRAQKARARLAEAMRVEEQRRKEALREEERRVQEEARRRREEEARLAELRRQQEDERVRKLREQEARRLREIREQEIRAQREAQMRREEDIKRAHAEAAEEARRKAWEEAARQRRGNAPPHPPTPPPRDSWGSAGQEWEQRYGSANTNENSWRRSYTNSSHSTPPRSDFFNNSNSTPPRSNLPSPLRPFPVRPPAAPTPETFRAAWASYESRWAALPNLPSVPSWSFTAVPWPLLHPPSSPSDLSPVAMRQFLLAKYHSEDKNRKDRIRAALLRWHPDKFNGKYLVKVRESEREMVKEGVNAVCRLLQELQAAN